MVKRVLCVTLALIICVSAVVGMTSCGKLPELDALKARFIYLIEQSKEMNVIFFGVGLPVYDRENELAQRLGVYYGEDMPAYDTVSLKSPYLSSDAIKERAEQIFSEEYLELIYESAFEGLVGSGSTYLRFYEQDGDIYQSVSATDFGLSERIYDYSTMKIVKPSGNEYINVTVETYTLDDAKRQEISLSFAFERGEWYLDCPTY